MLVNLCIISPNKAGFEGSRSQGSEGKAEGLGTIVPQQRDLDVGREKTSVMHPSESQIFWDKRTS
jgi:hypothetical protein